jgi:hypothetical protein
VLVAGEPAELVLVEPPLAAEAVHDLEVLARAAALVFPCIGSFSRPRRASMGDIEREKEPLRPLY